MTSLFRILYLLFIIMLFGCSQESIVPNQLLKNKPDEKFSTYQWSEYTLKNIRTLKDVDLTLTGNGIIRKSDSTFEVLALDTNRIFLRVKSSTFDQTDTLKAVQNKYFNPEWKKLGFSVTPTPLTEEEFKVFGVFNEYRLLNEPLPIFEIEATDGFLLDNSSFNGKITVLNFWYAGCIPCEAEMPALNKLQAKYKDDSEVQFLSLFKDSIYVNPAGDLSFQSSAISSEGMLPKKYDFNWKQFPNAWNKNRVFNIMAYPTNMVLDTTGVIRAIYVGASISGDDKMASAISKEIERLKKAE